MRIKHLGSFLFAKNIFALVRGLERALETYIDIGDSIKIVYTLFIEKVDELVYSGKWNFYSYMDTATVY